MGPLVAPPPRWDASPAPASFCGVNFKRIVYDTAPANLDDLEQRVRNAYLQITPEKRNKMYDNLEQRIFTCTAVDGDHFEHIL